MEIWPDSESSVLHLPIGGSVSIPISFLSQSGASMLVSGASHTVVVYDKLGSTQAASGSFTPVSYAAGTATISFAASQTGLLSQLKHYYWLVLIPSTNKLLLDGPVYAHRAGSWPNSPYRGHRVVTPYSVI